jgi:hypothetical protein
MLDVADGAGAVEDTASMEAARAAIRGIVAQVAAEPREPFEIPWNNLAFFGIAAAFVAVLYGSQALVACAAHALNF